MACVCVCVCVYVLCTVVVRDLATRIQHDEFDGQNVSRSGRALNISLALSFLLKSAFALFAVDQYLQRGERVTRLQGMQASLRQLSELPCVSSSSQAQHASGLAKVTTALFKLHTARQTLEELTLPASAANFWRSLTTLVSMDKRPSFRGSDSHDLASSIDKAFPNFSHPLLSTRRRRPCRDRAGYGGQGTRGYERPRETSRTLHGLAGDKVQAAGHPSC